jgi:chromosome segregation ATPase
MSMVDPTRQPLTGVELVNWLHDQVSALKAQIGRMQQQNEQGQAAVLDINEKLRDNEARLRELAARTMGLPVMQEQVRQLAGLLERIQDTEVLIDSKFEQMERLTGEERQRDQAEKNDLYRRVQDLERKSESLIERQASNDEAARRYQDEVSRNHLNAQSMGQRMESVESKAGRLLDALTRLEQTHSETEAAIRALRREDDVIAERARVAHDVAARLEQDMHMQAEEGRALPLLQERVELLRAERQRVEDRVSRLEEVLNEATVRLERQEEVTGGLDRRVNAHDQRIELVHTSSLDHRRWLSDHMLKLDQMMERMRRRQIEELERDVKDLRVHANQVKQEDGDDR